ncbi:Protein of unknown function [Pyronema omphalodes CBS 100304]|uniref:Uncharacterized protein n=1 Tax=Pyronema omphalodes (strain CBS 100304) TaxID=1076935 RepID=U4KZS4_PYROM|nr:Protein of unknown function [Pyronema omphalodes CBS 100304]
MFDQGQLISGHLKHTHSSISKRLVARNTTAKQRLEEPRVDFSRVGGEWGRIDWSNAWV